MIKWNKYPETKPDKRGLYMTCVFEKEHQSGFFKIERNYKLTVQEFVIHEDKEFWNVDGYHYAKKIIENPRFLQPLTHWSELPEAPTS
jgi:hypothetical protein